MLKIFLSYASEDREIVQNIFDKLHSVGYTPWMDRHEIYAGENWQESIVDGIDETDFFFFFFSSTSLDKLKTSDILEFEFQHGLSRMQGFPAQAFFIPIRIGEVNLPDELSAQQWIDLAEGDWWCKLKLGLLRAAKVRGLEIQKTPNPFQVAGRVEGDKFFPRQPILREIKSDLAKGTCISLYGESQIGKSSMLYHLYETSNEWMPDAQVHLIDFQRVFGQEDFCYLVLRELGKGGESLRDLRDALMDIQRSGSKLVLLLDELDKMADQNFTNDLRGLLRSFAQERFFSLCTVTQKPLNQIFTNVGLTSPFPNVFVTREIKALSDHEALALLNHYLMPTNQCFTAVQMGELITNANGYPRKLQQAAQVRYQETTP